MNLLNFDFTTISLQVQIIYYLGLFLSISLHESAHAYMAHYEGDFTPKFQGRLTLNPLKHLEPIGAILIILFGFGWGRPVEINTINLKNPKKSLLLIALVGPLTNLAIATILTIILSTTSSMGLFSVAMRNLIFVNIGLFVFNLIPLYPLDGSKIVYSLLPANLAEQWAETSKISPFIIILLLATGSLSSIISALMKPIIFILSFV